MNVVWMCVCEGWVLCRRVCPGSPVFLLERRTNALYIRRNRSHSIDHVGLTHPNAHTPIIYTQGASLRECPSSRRLRTALEKRARKEGRERWKED